MTSTTVIDQDGLNSALVNPAITEIYVDSPAGVWVELRDTGARYIEVKGSASVRAFGSASVRAFGSASVHASGSASVSAFDSASVRASGSASVHASGSASVRASDSASVRASGSASVSASDSASVRAFGSASVRAFGSASVRAFDSASVRAFGSASVSAFGSASVRAFGSASVRASGSASVSAFDSASVRAFGSASVHASGSASVHASGSASVRASKYVAVHLHSSRATVEGGVVIDLAQLNRSDPAAWCDMQGLEPEDGHVVVYKAVDDELVSDHGFVYPLGGTVEAPDWRATDECGYGLHFGPTPLHAAHYHSNSDAVRYLACRIPLDTMVGITDPTATAKCKAQRCEVLYEVDELGRKVESVVTAGGAR
jgi:hypothetical protein